ncbi:MAG: hypothetical protein LBQ31_02725 [Bacteroidales bacterium]|nr:hypothetical protein [Bacteroidales bacterium]
MPAVGSTAVGGTGFVWWVLLQGARLRMAKKIAAESPTPPPPCKLEQGSALILLRIGASFQSLRGRGNALIYQATGHQSFFNASSTK